MLNILLHRINLKHQIMLIIFSLFLTSCSNLDLLNNSMSNLLTSDANANSEYYINKVNQTTDLKPQQTYKLLASRVLINENKIAQAEALLAELHDLTTEQTLDKSLIDAHISAVKGLNDLAQQQLKMINLTLLSNSQKARYYKIQARIAENRHEIIEAVNGLTQVDALTTDMQYKQENNNHIWELLRNANKGLINSTIVENNMPLAGWLALAKAYNDNINQPSQLSSAFQNWKNAYPTHSAAYIFPTELQGLSNFQQTQLTKIALLLPTTGNGQLISNTIKAGFDYAKGDSNVAVQVIDTASISIASAIEQAKQQGAQAIVGPLLKNDVDTLLNNTANLQGLNVLTLNSTSMARAVPHLCYYGLSPEDEAESAADRMWEQGIRNPFIIVPQNDLGQRTAFAFNVRWQQLAATDANIKFYNQPEDIGSILQSGINQSTQALYIIATSEQLAPIKSIIDNANLNLALYASSRSNSANNGPEYRLQMEGLQFSDIPFFKDTESLAYKKVAELTHNDYSLMRLYAMGADAWLLINHFNEISQIPGYKMSGLTGTLSTGPNCNIERSMSWMQYKNGVIQVLN